MRVFTHAHVSMITYCVDVYRSRPIGASLLTTSPQQDAWPERPAHGLAGRGDGYPLKTDLDWGLSSADITAHNVFQVTHTYLLSTCLQFSLRYYLVLLDIAQHSVQTKIFDCTLATSP